MRCHRITTSRPKSLFDWWNIFSTTAQGSDINYFAYKKILEFDDVVERLMSYYRKSRHRKIKRLEFLFDKIPCSKATLDQWLLIYLECYDSGTKIDKIAFRKASELNATLEEWLVIYERSKSYCPEVWQLAHDRIFNSKFETLEWYKILGKIRYDSELVELARERISESGMSYGELSSLHLSELLIRA